MKHLLFSTPALLPGVHDALNSAGLAGRVKLIGEAPANTAQLFLVKSQVLAWIAGEQPGGAMWWRATDAAARVVEDLKVTPHAPVPPNRIITAKNAAASLIDPPTTETHS